MNILKKYFIMLTDMDDCDWAVNLSQIVSVRKSVDYEQEPKYVVEFSNGDNILIYEEEYINVLKKYVQEDK